MDKNFVNYFIASKMVELGFNDKCIATINEYDSIHINCTKRLPSGTVATNEIPLPTWSECFDWFREKHNRIITVYSNASGYLWETHDSVGGTQREWSDYSGPNESGTWDNFYEARENAVNTNLEIIKNNQNVKK